MKQSIETAPKDFSKILLYGDLRLHGCQIEENEAVEKEWHIGYWDGYWSDGDCGEIFYPIYWAELPSVDE